MLILLKCPAEVELRRIVRRRRKAEKSISLGYLQNLNRALEARVAGLPRSAKVLRIDSAAVNFVRDPKAIREVVKQVQRVIQ
jgi:deoxyadenosine/deoxycytidine kinase